MEKEAVERGYAKINLHLDVTGMLDDGYHAVTTVMQTVSVYDEITISDVRPTVGKSVFELECNVDGVPCDEKNLAYRAALMFCEKTGVSMRARIYIKVQHTIMLTTPLSPCANTARDMIIPAYIAIPPNLGIALLCILLSSLGTSMAPIKGAALMDKGVTIRATAKATRKGPHKSKLVAVTIYSPNITILKPASFNISTDRSSGYPSLTTILPIPAFIIILAQITHG